MYYVYILASKKYGVLYIGVTNNLFRRGSEHFAGVSVNSFTKKYHIQKLIYFEKYKDVREAIHREKCLKRWKREWKIKLIEGMNPEWKDYFLE